MTISNLKIHRKDSNFKSTLKFLQKYQRILEQQPTFEACFYLQF